MIENISAVHNLQVQKAVKELRDRIENARLDLTFGEEVMHVPDGKISVALLSAGSFLMLATAQLDLALIHLKGNLE